MKSHKRPKGVAHGKVKGWNFSAPKDYPEPAAIFKQGEQPSGDTKFKRATTKKKGK